MLIYNTLTRKKEEFKPIDPPNVKMYVCGPTVYDYFHIGNARSFIMADILRKYLVSKGYVVTYAMNLTDVDDKIIKKSNEQKKSPVEIAEYYISAFFEDIEKLKIKKADIYPKATAHMADIIKMIKSLRGPDDFPGRRPQSPGIQRPFWRPRDPASADEAEVQPSRTMPCRRSGATRPRTGGVGRSRLSWRGHGCRRLPG